MKVAPPCERMAGVECGCGLGPGPAAQEELLLFRNPRELRCGGAGTRDPGNPGDGERAAATCDWPCSVSLCRTRMREAYVAAALLLL